MTCLNNFQTFMENLEKVPTSIDTVDNSRSYSRSRSNSRSRSDSISISFSNSVSNSVSNCSISKSISNPNSNSNFSQNAPSSYDAWIQMVNDSIQPLDTSEQITTYLHTSIKFDIDISSSLFISYIHDETLRDMNMNDSEDRKWLCDHATEIDESINFFHSFPNPLIPNMMNKEDFYKKTLSILVNKIHYFSLVPDRIFVKRRTFLFPTNPLVEDRLSNINSENIDVNFFKSNISPFLSDENLDLDLTQPDYNVSSKLLRLLSYQFISKFFFQLTYSNTSPTSMEWIKSLYKLSCNSSVLSLTILTKKYFYQINKCFKLNNLMIPDQFEENIKNSFSFSNVILDNFFHVCIDNKSYFSILQEHIVAQEIHFEELINCSPDHNSSSLFDKFLVSYDHGVKLNFNLNNLLNLFFYVVHSELIRIISFYALWDDFINISTTNNKIFNARIHFFLSFITNMYNNFCRMISIHQQLIIITNILASSSSSSCSSPYDNYTENILTSLEGIFIIETILFSVFNQLSDLPFECPEHSLKINFTSESYFKLLLFYLSSNMSINQISLNAQLFHAVASHHSDSYSTLFNSSHVKFESSINPNSSSAIPNILTLNNETSSNIYKCFKKFLNLFLNTTIHSGSQIRSLKELLRFFTDSKIIEKYFNPSVFHQHFPAKFHFFKLINSKKDLIIEKIKYWLDFSRNQIMIRSSNNLRVNSPNEMQILDDIYKKSSRAFEFLLSIK